MDLDSINFKVETGELANAITLLGGVTKAVSGLTEAVTKQTAAKDAGSKANAEELTSLREQAKLKGVEADAAKKSAQAAEAESKAKVAKIREEKELTKVVKDSSSASDVLTESMTASERILAKQALSMQILRGEVITTSDGVAFLGNSFTKSQAGMLANLQLLGATGKELQTLSASFKDYNAITGLNTFDKSASGISKMKKELQELNEVNSISASGLALTRDEITNFVRDSERLVQQQKSEGHSAEWLAEEQKMLRASYISTSVELNRLRAESKQMEDQAKKTANNAIKATQDQLKAEEYVAREMNRVQQATINSRDGTTTSTSNQLVRMEAALKASGISAGEAANKIRVYKDQLLALQKVANNKQIDNISRALGPQITDIGVGLATGQSPLTILLQQGGQLRDQMALAGVAAEDMGKAIRRAGSEMAGSVWTTGKGVITGIGGALLDMGKSAGEGVGTAILKMVDYTNYLKGGREYQKRFNEEVANGNGALSKMFDILTGSTASSIFGAGIIALATALVSLGVALAQVIKEENALSKALILTGGALGLNKDSAYAYVEEMKKLGITGSQATQALTAIAESGKFTRSEIDNVTRAAVALNKAAGVEIKETVAEFAKIKEKPVEALTELAIKLGTIPPATIAAVRAARDYGSELEAQKLAQKAYADAAVEAAGRVRDEMGSLTLAAKAFGDAWSQQWSRVLDLFRGNDLSDAALLATKKASLSQMQKAGPAWYQTEAAWQEKLRDEQGWIDVYTEKVNKAQDEAAKKQQNADIARTEKNLESFRNTLLKERKSKMSLAEYLKAEVPNILGESSEVVKLRDGLTGNNQYVTAVAAATKQWTDMQKKNTDATKQAAKELSFYQATIRSGTSALETNIGAIANLTNATSKLNAIQSDPRFKQLSEERQAEIVRIYEQASAMEAFAEQLKKSIALKEELLKVDLEYKALAESEALRQQQANQELDHELELLGKTVEQQKALNIEFEKKTKLQALELKLKKDIAEAEKKYGPDIVGAMDAEKQLYEAYAKDVELINKGAAVASAKAYFEEFDKIRGAVSDIISDALFHGGKGGSKKLRDAIMDQLKKPINVVINVIANAVTNGIQGMIGGSSGVMGQSGGFGGLGSIVDMGKNLYSMFTGGAGVGLVSTIGGAASSIGSMIGSTALAEFGAGISGSTLAAGLAGPTTAGATGAMGLGSSVGGLLGTIGSAMPYIAAAMVVLDAIGATERWAGDPDAFLVQETKSNRPDNLNWSLNDGLKSVFDGTAVKTDSGMNPYSTSATTPFGTIGFANGNAVIKKNGQFISELGETEDVSTENQQAVLKIFSTYDKVVASALSESQVAKIAEDLQGWYRKSWSFEGDMIGQWVADRYRTIFQVLGTDIGNIFAGLDLSEGNLGNVVALFTIVQGSAGKIAGLVDSIKSFSDGTSKYIRENEKGAEALIRLITNLEGSNKLLDAIGQKTYASSLVGADMAQQLVDLFGSLANLQSGIGTYYDKFYTEQEKVATSTKNLQIVFKAMGMSMPQSTEQFRKLVDAQDLTTVKGRETFTALIGISSAFADLMQPVDEATNKMKEFTASILEYIANLTLTEGASGNTFNAVTGQFSAQVIKARGGDTSAMDSITDYADRVLEVAKDTASSTYEYEKILGSVKAELLGLTNGQTAGTILTTAAVTSSTTSTSPITTIADSSASTQELLVSILAKLTEMQSEERAEGEASVTNLSTIAKVFKRIDNGDSIRVINV